MAETDAYIKVALQLGFKRGVYRGIGIGIIFSLVVSFSMWVFDDTYYRPQRDRLQAQALKNEKDRSHLEGYGQAILYSHETGCDEWYKLVKKIDKIYESYGIPRTPK